MYNVNKHTQSEPDTTCGSIIKYSIFALPVLEF